MRSRRLLTHTSPSTEYFVDIRRPADGADSGAIDFIATRGDSKPWINPGLYSLYAASDTEVANAPSAAESGNIEITSSDLLEDSEPISAIVGRSAARCVTRGNKGAWITIDLLRCRLRPTAYSLKHYAASDVEALRWWKLEVLALVASQLAHSSSVSISGLQDRSQLVHFVGSQRRYIVVRSMYDSELANRE